MITIICALWLAFSAYRILANALTCYEPGKPHELLSSICGGLFVWLLLGWLPVGIAKIAMRFL